MGIDTCAPDCLVEGNVVDRFSGDAIRATRDGIVVRHNVLTNNFVVKDNVVRVNAYHGVAVYDGQGCSVTGNVCLAQDAASKSKPWVMLGQKRNLAKGNTVRDNRAHSFNFKADAAVTASNNTKIDPDTFRKRQTAALTLINQQFGKLHPVA